jgi:hypothetical protein
LGYDQYSLVAKVDTGGASLSAAPVLGLPTSTPSYLSGSVTFPTGTGLAPNWPTGNGHNRYQFGNAWATPAALAANVGSGTFTFTLGDATATPTLTLNTANPALPVTPLVTSGGTWSGGTLLIDPSVTTTLQFNSGDFTTYTAGGNISVNLFATAAYPTPLIAQSMSQYGLGKTDPALSLITFSAGTMTAGIDYLLQVNYSQLGGTNTTAFTGTGISGSPLGISYDTSSTFVDIHAVPEPAGIGYLGLGTAAWLWLSAAGGRRRART